MKKAIFAMVLLGVAGMSVSCRVDPPLDPHTLTPSTKCCPENFSLGHPTSCHTCGKMLIQSSK